MAREVDFATGTIVSADYLDAQQEVESSLAWGIRLTKTSTSVVSVVPAADGSLTGSASLRINGIPRWATAPISVTISGANGTYNIYAVGSGSTFTLAFAAGAGPANSRKIGEVDYASSAITQVRNMVDSVSGHGALHSPGAADAIPKMATTDGNVPFDLVSIVSSLAARLRLSDTGASTSLRNFEESTDGGVTELRARSDDWTTIYWTFLRFLHSTGQTIVGTTSPQGPAKLSSVIAGNAFEWGHTNLTGYRCNLGAEEGTGKPFIAFFAEADKDNQNRYKTRSLNGIVIRAEFDGSLTFNSLATPNATNQSLVTFAKLDDNGVLTLGDRTVVGSVRGLVDPVGTIVAGSGFTVNNSSTGVYIIDFTTPFKAPPHVLVTISKATSTFDVVPIVDRFSGSWTASRVTIRMDSSSTGSPTNCHFFFEAKDF